MTDSLSPIQITKLVFTEVRISAQLDGDPTVNMQTNVEFGGAMINNNNRLWQVTVRVSMAQCEDSPKPVYTGDVQCVGLLSVADGWPEETIEKLVLTNGTGLLYASIREMISNITARGPWPPITIVSQSFLKSYENRALSVKK